MVGAVREELRRRVFRRRACGEKGAAVLETVLVLPILIALLMATVAFGMGAVAKAILINAVRDSARLAAIECGQGVVNWYGDALAAASAALGHGLYLGALTTSPASYGEWSFQASCTPPATVGGSVYVQLVYDEVDLFPPLGALLASGGALGGRVFRLEAAAAFPEE